MDSLTGRLLVATPALTDRNFIHTVVLILDHGDHGAVGVVLNRPSELTVKAVVPDWSTLAGEPPVVFVGGPVQPDAVIALARVGADVPGVRQLLPGVGLIDLAGEEPLTVSRLQAVRFFAGYAGWGDEQLDGEIASGGWFVLDGTAADVFTSGPQQLWRRVLVRQGGVFRTVSENPSLN